MECSGQQLPDVKHGGHRDFDVIQVIGRGAFGEVHIVSDS